MNMPSRLLAASLLASAALVGVASAETTLRLDETPIGELDPAKATDYADSILMFNVYDTLVIPKQGEAGYQPFLAESWTQEGNTFTFKLRQDVKFQSGNALTSDDVVFSFDRMMAIKSGFSFLFDNVEKAEAIDASTVKFTTKFPYAPFVAALVRLPILDKKLVMEHLGNGDGEMKDWGQSWLNLNTAGSGAYSVVSHDPQAETVMAKNPGYFLGVPAAAPDKVRLRYGLEAATVRTLISQGEHDISSQWLPPEVLKSLSKDGFKLLSESGTAQLYIKLNTAKPPFDDLECRLAIVNAFDYSTGIKMVAVTDTVSQGAPSTGAIPVGGMGADPEAPVFKQDLDAAKAHLAKCKYKPEDMNVELSWIGEVPLEERFALLLQANLNQIGVKSEIRKVPWTLFTEQVTKPENTPNVSQVFVDTMDGDTDTLLYSMYHSSAGGTWMSPEYLKDPEVDSLLDKGRASASEAERSEIYKALDRRLVALAPTIYAQNQRAVFAASNKVSVPALQDPAKAFRVAAFGFTFRLMEMQP